MIKSVIDDDDTQINLIFLVRSTNIDFIYYLFSFHRVLLFSNCLLLLAIVKTSVITLKTSL